MRRIDIAAANLGDIAQPQHAPADGEINAGDVLLGAKRTGHSDRHGFVAGLYFARWPDDVLRLKRSDQRAAIDAEACQLPHRELDENPFVLRAENLDLRNVGQAEQARAHIFDIIAQLPLRESVGGEAVDDAERVAELVVEERA